MNTFVALCAIGAEKVLGNEIKHLGYKLLDNNAPGRVIFLGDNDTLYRANFCLRTSDRVYLQMARYKAFDFDALFEGAYTVDWQDFLKKDVRVVVDKVRMHKSKLNSEPAIQAMIQKAIYQKLQDMWRMSSLPESGAKTDVRVYIDSNEVVLLLDTSGEPLYKRGYRAEGGIAPLRETIAAVLLQEMLWRRKLPLHDPFCGSGTIPVEASLFAQNVAPGLLGRHFAFENLLIFDSKRSLEIKKEEMTKIKTDVEFNIKGSDIDSKMIENAKSNAELAFTHAEKSLRLVGIETTLIRPSFFVGSFSDLKKETETGQIVCNPPYGERLGDRKEAETLYCDMGFLLEHFKNWQFGIITSQKSFQDCFGKKASVVKILKAGNLDTSFYIYR